MRRHGWVLKVVAAAAIMTVWSSSARALTIGPSVVELRAPAGGRATGQFTVSNETSGPILVMVEAEPLAPKGYVPVEPSVWLTLTPSSVILQAGESANVAYAIHVPHDAAGELASEVVFVQHIGADKGGVQVRMGMAIYTAITGTERLALSLEHMALQAGKDGGHIQMRVANQGNIHCRPEGTVSLTAADGRVVAQGKLNRGMPIHPEGAGTFMVPITLPEPGSYQLAADLTCQASAESPVRLTSVQQGAFNAAGSWVASTPVSIPSSAGAGR